MSTSTTFHFDIKNSGLFDKQLNQVEREFADESREATHTTIALVALSILVGTVGVYLLSHGMNYCSADPTVFYISGCTLTGISLCVAGFAIRTHFQGQAGAELRKEARLEELNKAEAYAEALKEETGSVKVRNALGRLWTDPRAEVLKQCTDLNHPHVAEALAQNLVLLAPPLKVNDLEKSFALHIFNKAKDSDKEYAVRLSELYKHGFDDWQKAEFLLPALKKHPHLEHQIKDLSYTDNHKTLLEDCLTFASRNKNQAKDPLVAFFRLIPTRDLAGLLTELLLVLKEDLKEEEKVLIAALAQVPDLVELAHKETSAPNPMGMPETYRMHFRKVMSPQNHTLKNLYTQDLNKI